MISWRKLDKVSGGQVKTSVGEPRIHTALSLVGDCAQIFPIALKCVEIVNSNWSSLSPEPPPIVFVTRIRRWSESHKTPGISQDLLQRSSFCRDCFPDAQAPLGPNQKSIHVEDAHFHPVGCSSFEERVPPRFQVVRLMTQGFSLWSDKRSKGTWKSAKRWPDVNGRRAVTGQQDLAIDFV